VISNTLYLA